MKNRSLCCVVLFQLAHLFLFSQSTFEDAKNLMAFKQLYNANQRKVTQLGTNTAEIAKMNLQLPEVQESLARRVLNWRSRLRANKRQNPAGAVGLTGPVAQGGGLQPAAPAAATDLDASMLQRIQEEMKWYIAFVESDAAVFNQNKVPLTELKNFPQSFEFLEATVAALESSPQTASFTSSAGLGSLVSISQTEILKGITDWALDRAQKELMQAFLQDWLDQLHSDPVLQTIFPNTLSMLSTKSVTTFFTDGDTWKATFQQDFDRLPAHIPEIAEVALREAGEPLTEAKKKELISGLAIAVNLFQALGNNKRPEETLQLIAQQAYLRTQSQTVDQVATIDRSLMGIGTLIKSIQDSTGAVPSYINPGEVLALSEPELQAFWKLLYLREGQRLKYVFNLPNVTAEADFYHSIRDTTISKLQARLAHVAESIQGINTLVNTIKTTQNQTFTGEAFHNYVLLTLDFLELGITTLEDFGVNTLDIVALQQYKATYSAAYEQISKIIEGVKTKNYGGVVLNTVNLILFIKELAVQEQGISFQVEDYASKVTGEVTSANLEALTAALKDVANQQLTNFPDSKEIVLEKLKQLESALKAAKKVPKHTAIELLRFHLRLTIEEQRIVLKETASEFLSLERSGAAIHRYGNLMVNIVMAKDSKDVENALEVAAMETGGYLVKQRSRFSTTVSFFPGIQAGWEQLDGADVEEGNGSYLGATLPIGVELAWGTGWKKGIGAVGVFVQVLDLGAVLNYSLDNDNANLNNRTDFGFKEVLSPGSYLLLHAKNIPIVLGAGVSYAPALREIRMDDVTVEANALQFGFFAGVDLNIFTLFASDRKISSQGP